MDTIACYIHTKIFVKQIKITIIPFQLLLIVVINEFGKLVNSSGVTDLASTALATKDRTTNSPTLTTSMVFSRAHSNVDLVSTFYSCE